jgi:putative phosphoribosyl transferase
VARALGAARIVLAVPVAAPDALELLRAVADDVVCLEAPPGFYAVGQWYDDFRATSDDDVEALLREHAAASGPAPPAPRSPPPEDRDGEVVAGPLVLPGRLTVPEEARGLVVFAHGSGSSRFSARNLTVAGVLHRGGLATLLFDLLTAEEDLDRDNVFDIGLLGARLAAATTWVRARPGLQDLRLGYFGASTGAAAALWAAASADSEVAAVVSRGGRPDLAAERLAAVRAPTLQVVGGRDEVVLELNRQAAARLACPHELVVVPGATHLFEEPGALRAAAELARGWFTTHLAVPAAARR